MTETEVRPRKKKTKEHTDENGLKDGNKQVISVIVDYLLFRRMITPLIIQFLFWATTLLLVCTGIYEILDGVIPQNRAIVTSSGIIGETRTTTYSGEKKSDLREVVIGFLTMTIGPLLLRLYCELLILFFRMNETLTDIRSNTSPK